MNCNECKFWDGTIEDEFGECRKKSPRPMVEHNLIITYVEGDINTHTLGDARTIWPKTHANDWCGDFEAIKNLKPAEPKVVW